MNRRQQKKLENRAGFFHYRDYKLRMKILYDIFGSYDGPYIFKAYMFRLFKTILFTKAPTKIFNMKYRRYPMPELENSGGSRFGRYNDIASTAVDVRIGPPPLTGPIKSIYGGKSVKRSSLSSLSVAAIANRIIPDDTTIEECVKDTESIEHMNSTVFDLRKNNRGEDGLLR